MQTTALLTEIPVHHRSHLSEVTKHAVCQSVICYLTSSSSACATPTGVEVLHAIAEALRQLLGHDDGSHWKPIANGLS